MSDISLLVSKLISSVPGLLIIIFLESLFEFTLLLEFILLIFIIFGLFFLKPP
jgi:hypothetical protein